MSWPLEDSKTLMLVLFKNWELTRCLARETISSPTTDVNWEAEVKKWQELSEELEPLVDLFDGSVDIKRFECHLGHLLGKLSRVDTDDVHLIATAANIKEQVGT